MGTKITYEMQAYWDDDRGANPPFEIEFPEEFDEIRKGMGWVGTNARLIRKETVQTVEREERG